MKWLAFLFVVIFTTSCGHAPIYKVETPLEEYVERFQVEAHARGVNYKLDDLIIDFGAIEKTGDENFVGMCYWGSDAAPPHIAIDKNFWSYATPEEKECLIMHEMGHCILGRPHEDGSLPDGTYKSIMHWSVLPPWMFKNHRQYYMDEFFEPVAKKREKQ